MTNQSDVKFDISGAAVFWSVTRSLRAVLAAGVQGMGMDGFVPPERTPKAVLHDAMRELFQKPTTLVRPLSDRAAFTVVDESRGTVDIGNEYVTVLTASVDDDGRVTCSPDDHQDRIQRAYDANREQLPASAVSSMLVSILENRLGGFPLRPRGAIYWIPRTSLAKWRELRDIVESAAVANAGSNAVYAMQSGMDAETIRAVRDGIAAEISSATETIESDLDAGALGERAISTRLDQCGDMFDRLKTYEQILGITMTDLRKGIEACQESALRAQLVASSQFTSAA